MTSDQAQIARLSARCMKLIGVIDSVRSIAEDIDHEFVYGEEIVKFIDNFMENDTEVVE